MGISAVRTSGKRNGLVTGGEVNIEPGYECMDEVGFAAWKREGRVKSELLFRHCVQIDLVHLARVGDASFDFDRVYQRLCQRRVSQWREIEAVDIIPD